MTADDRDSVRSNIEQLGALGALLWAEKELPKVAPGNVAKRRILVLTVMEAARQAEFFARRARRLARCHRQGLIQAKAWKP